MNKRETRPTDDLDDLGDCLKTMSVRSQSSAKRMAFRINRPSQDSFYAGAAPSAIDYQSEVITAGNNADDDEDEDDSTYEASSESESLSVPSVGSFSQEMPAFERQEMEFCESLPSQYNENAIENDDGISLLN